MRFLPLALACLAPLGAHAQGTLLRLHYVPGARYVLTTHDTTDQRVQVEMPGMGAQDQNTRAIRYSEHETTVTADGDTAVVLSAAYRRMRLHTVTAGLAEIVDTDSAASIAGSRFGGLLAGFMRQPVRMRVSRTGRTTLLTDLDSMLAPVLRLVPGSAEDREAARIQIRGVLESVTQGQPFTLPAGPVQVGEAWTSEMTLPGPFPFAFKTTSRYTPGPDGLSRITSTVRVERDTVTIGEAPVSMQLQLSMSGSGTTDLDPHDGAYASTNTMEMESQNVVDDAPGAPELRMRMYSYTRSRARMVRVE